MPLQVISVDSVIVLINVLFQLATQFLDFFILILNHLLHVDYSGCFVNFLTQLLLQSTFLS
jgi:hypothetical protein